ncbi:MAG: hypothetical protein GX166_11445 [Clostridiaceae bacterium]|nr:hypothetical protein [Clostridiaceae bacterium]
MKKPLLFTAMLLVLCIFVSAYTYTTDESFEDEEVGSSYVDLDKFSYDWGHSVVHGETVIQEEDGNKYLKVTGFSEFYSYDPITAPYTFSLDLKMDTVGDVNVFVRAGRNEIAPFPFYEWDWYEEKGGTNGKSSTGGPGLLVSLLTDSVRIRIKNMQMDSENEQISSVYHDFPMPETYNYKEFNNIKFVDDGEKIEIFVNNELIATCDMSDKGRYEVDAAHPPVDFEYFKKAVLKDSEGNVVLELDNARLVAEECRVAFGGRSHPFYVDNVAMSYEVEDTPAPTDTPEPAPTDTEAPKETEDNSETPDEDGKKAGWIPFVVVGVVLVLACVVIAIIVRRRAVK